MVLWSKWKYCLWVHRSPLTDTKARHWRAFLLEYYTDTMKKFLFFLPLILVISYCLLESQPNIPTQPPELPLPSEPKIRKIDSQNEIVIHINQSIDSFLSVAHENVTINYNGLKLFGDMIYQKDKNFRCLIYSNLGLESDMGSNAENFWFWSKRMESSNMYFGRHSDADKTRLKGELSPRWAMEVLNLRKISPKAEILLHKGHLYALETTNKYIYVTMIDMHKKAMLSHVIYTLDGNAIAGSVNNGFYEVNGHLLPREITITWYDEQVSVIWKFKEPQVNAIPSDKAFIMPDYEPKVDLSGL